MTAAVGRCGGQVWEAQRAAATPKAGMSHARSVPAGSWLPWSSAGSCRRVFVATRLNSHEAEGSTRVPAILISSCLGEQRQDTVGDVDSNDV